MIRCPFSSLHVTHVDIWIGDLVRFWGHGLGKAPLVTPRGTPRSASSVLPGPPRGLGCRREGPGGGGDAAFLAEVSMSTISEVLGRRVQLKGLIGKRAMKCPYCDFYFMKNGSDLQRHIWAHEGECPRAAGRGGGTLPSGASLGRPRLRVSAGGTPLAHGEACPSIPSTRGSAACLVAVAVVSGVRLFIALLKDLARRPCTGSKAPSVTAVPPVSTRVRRAGTAEQCWWSDLRALYSHPRGGSDGGRDGCR